jgi:ATP-dependent Zn protease
VSQRKVSCQEKQARSFKMREPYLSIWKKILLETVEEDLGSEYRIIFAHHEAGHAIAAVLLGEPILNVNMNPDAQLNGEIVFGFVETEEAPDRLKDISSQDYEDLSLEDRDILERNIMVSLAGEIYIRPIFDKEEVEGFEDDFEHVERVINWMFKSPEDRKAYRELLSTRLKEMFNKKENLHAAGVFANTLLRNVEISGEEATHIIKEALADSPEVDVFDT